MESNEPMRFEIQNLQLLALLHNSKSHELPLNWLNNVTPGLQMSELV